jgi:hypothetical protein
VRVLNPILTARYCGVCQHSCVPPPALAEIAVGSSRFGQRVQEELVTLASPFVAVSVPQSVWCKRLLQCESEMFTFVEYLAVPSENNPAERAIRSRVIARKIRGATRSPVGSPTMVVLSSLFVTWPLRAEEWRRRMSVCVSPNVAGSPAATPCHVCLKLHSNQSEQLR